MDQTALTHMMLERGNTEVAKEVAVKIWELQAQRTRPVIIIRSESRTRPLISPSRQMYRSRIARRSVSTSSEYTVGEGNASCEAASYYSVLRFLRGASLVITLAYRA